MSHSPGMQKIYGTAAVTKALPCKEGGKVEPLGVHLLVPRHEILLSLWAIKSFYHYSRANYPLTFHCQGEFLPEEMAFVKGHFPTARIITEAEADERIEEILRSRSLDRLSRLRKRELLFRKVLDFCLLSETTNVLSFDPDVLFFREPTELMVTDPAPLKYCLFQKDCFYSYRISEEAALSDLGIELTPRLNCGIILRARDWVELELLERIVQHEVFDEKHWHNEQTLHALAASSLGIARTMPSHYYLEMKPAANPREMTARHYCTPIREEFEREGIRLLEENGFLKEATLEIGAPRFVSSLSRFFRLTGVSSLLSGKKHRAVTVSDKKPQLTFPSENDMPEVTGVYLMMAAHEVPMARICIASIKFWYPDMRVTIVKDLSRGDFDLGSLENDWGCVVESLGHGQYGWGLGKIEIITKPKRERVLILDPDVLMAGPIIELLQTCPMDFVLSIYRNKEWFKPELYYDEQKLKAFDPEFTYPGYYFNSGQMIATTGILTRDDFSGMMEFGQPFSIVDPELFPCVDQSLLNYVLPREELRGRLGVGGMRFMRWGWSDLDNINFFNWRAGIGYPYLVHWAGPKPAGVLEMNGSHLWRFFDYFDRHRKVPPLSTMQKWFAERSIELR